jgi:hypothetical protein
MSSMLSSLPRGADQTPDLLVEKLEDPRIVEALERIPTSIDQ